MGMNVWGIPVSANVESEKYSRNSKDAGMTVIKSAEKMR